MEATAIAAGFIAALFLGSVLLPGSRASGPDPEGKTRTYKLNGLALFLCVAAAAGVAQLLGWVSLAALQERFAALFVAANVVAFALTAWCYRYGRGAGATEPKGLRGLFFGRGRHPTWLGVDLKLFSYRPSLIALALFNASFAVAQFEAYGELTTAMALYQVFTFLYVINFFQFEYGMIHTWDLTSERFGWMLIWGDYVLVPFFYSLPGWWLVHAPDTLPRGGAVALIVLFLLGGWLFRGANEQKHRFKKDSGATIWGKPAESLDGRLLVSGFWGIGRHLNYTGEICIYFAFTLTTGFGSWAPYLLPAWLVALLWHRSRRDDRRCRAKYGALWQRYTQRVRYSMLPLIY